MDRTNVQVVATTIHRHDRAHRAPLRGAPDSRRDLGCRPLSYWRRSIRCRLLCRANRMVPGHGGSLIALQPRLSGRLLFHYHLLSIGMAGARQQEQQRRDYREHERDELEDVIVREHRRLA